ncbi:AsmA family protein [Leptospira sp. GIMC2001]|uniref:AsmA family protein n=1 Tax=Leptospira sp. GIMC2001 TaxID=1513297 RepID=UPI002349BBE8|nr:AsmA-like C-terminal region-containing protein [Leptospira sp. GIMC2001]WCL48538.1 AsmA family protein [Leptospira sp. GIMC2001]
MRLIRNVFFVISYFFLIFLIISIFLFNYIDHETYKKYLISEIKNKTDFRIEFIYSELVMFPYPGLQVDYLTIYDNDLEVASIKSVLVELSILQLILGQIEIRNLDIESGTINIVRNKDGGFDVLDQFLGQNIDEESSLTANELFSLIPESIKLNNIHLNFQDDFYSKNYKIYIWKNNFKVSKFTNSLDINFYGKLNNHKIEFYSQLYFSGDEISYESLRMNCDIVLKEFNVSLAEDILVIFPQADFKDTKISGLVKVAKNDSDLVRIHLTQAIIEGFIGKSGKSFGDIRGSTWISYSYKDQKLLFDDIELEWAGKIKARGYGSVGFDSRPVIYFKADADYIHLDSVMKIVNLWLFPNLDKSPLLRDLPDTDYDKRVTVTLDLKLRNANLFSQQFEYANTKIIYRNRKAYIRDIQMKIFKGFIFGDAEVFFNEKNNAIAFKGKVLDMDVKELIEKIQTRKYLTGFLSSELEWKTNGYSIEDFAKNIDMKGNYQLNNGALIDYLNFLRPIASIGKLINFTGPKGKSTAYESIIGEFRYKKEIVYIDSMKMKGVGLDAVGSGRVGLDKKIYFRITVSLGGVAGKAIKLPIIYMGKFGENLPFIDPVWLGAVFAGSIFLAGPAGAAVGGIAGSAVSDYVDNAVSGIRSIFSFTKDSIFGKSDSNSDSDD